VGDVHAGLEVLTAAEEVATPLPAGSWWYTVHELSPGVAAADVGLPPAPAGNNHIINAETPSTTKAILFRPLRAVTHAGRRLARISLPLPMSAG
jgi:hypothetical protein